MTTPPLAGRHKFATQQLRLGRAHYDAKRIAEAIAAYQHGIDHLEDGLTGRADGKDVAELYTARGNASLAQGDLATAAASYEAAHRLSPDLTACLCGLATVCLRRRRPQDAIALCRRILDLDPNHWLARINLAQALGFTHDYGGSKALLSAMAGERPRDALVHNQLGKLYFQLGELEPALDCFRHAVALNPNDADSLYWLGGTRHAMGDWSAAETDYARAARLQPFMMQPADRYPPEFSVLILFSPVSGNTPIQFVLKQSPYEANVMLLFPDVEYDATFLRRSGQVIVNLISDADRSRALLPLALELIDRVGRPTVNHPRKIQRTTREAIAALLQDIHGCRVPRVVRLACEGTLSSPAPEALCAGPLPVLARPVGTHGGDDFEKVGSLETLAAFLREHPDSDHYLIEYVDYRSPDGFFRKYRFIFVDDRILPYHLAIGAHWKLHHITTDMLNQKWMQEEEAAFLENPTGIFGPEQYQALRAIQQAVGLDYFGIDCGLDPAGNIVVFEVNASMLVHERADFPYAARSVQNIKLAFDEMLRKLAASAQA